MAQVSQCNLKGRYVPTNDGGHREQVIFVSVVTDSAGWG